MTPQDARHTTNVLTTFLDDIGVAYTRRDVYGNTFLKLDAFDKTIRIGDAAIDERFRYRYNVMTTHAHYDRATKQFFYPPTSLKTLSAQLLHDINRSRCQAFALQQ